MKKSVSFLVFACCCMAIFAQQNNVNIRLAKIAYYNYNANKPKPDMVYDFFYDASGNINKINYYQDGALFEVTNNYIFDSNNKIISYDTKNVEGKSARHHFINYDEQNRRTKTWETVLQDGKTVNGNTIYYTYSKNKITAITEKPTFAGKIYDTLNFKLDEDGNILKSGMEKKNPNPLSLTGNNGLDIDVIEQWPVANYFAEAPTVYQPTFGTTTTLYKYDAAGLLLSYQWKYTTEKENVVTSTGKTIFTYINLNKKNKKKE